MLCAVYKETDQLLRQFIVGLEESQWLSIHKEKNDGAQGRMAVTLVSTVSHLMEVHCHTFSNKSRTHTHGLQVQ